MPNQVDGAFVRAPCPVPSCPAYEPNFGSVLLEPINKTPLESRGPTLLCNQVPWTLRTESPSRTGSEVIPRTAVRGSGRSQSRRSRPL